MAIGNPVSVAGLNGVLGDAAVSIRDATFAALKLWSYVDNLGANEAAQVAALEGLGFAAGDAQAFWTAANEAFALYQIYQGIIAQPAAFDYDNALALARGAS